MCSQTVVHITYPCAHLLTTLCSALCSSWYGLCGIASPNISLFRLGFYTTVTLWLLVDWQILGGRGCHDYYCIRPMRPNTGPCGTPRERLITFKETKLLRIKILCFCQRTNYLTYQQYKFSVVRDMMRKVSQTIRREKKREKKVRQSSSRQTQTREVPLFDHFS